MHDENRPAAMTLDQIRESAARIAAEMKRAAKTEESLSGTGGGSRHRGLPEELRIAFIGLRAALFQRGVYDPLLVRFDTATVAQAPTPEIADRLASWGQV